MSRPVSDLQKSTIFAVVSIFETGRLPSPTAYSTATILGDGAGISYGAHQATDKAGSLDAIVRAYVEAPGARFAAELRPYLPDLAADTSITRPTTARTFALVDLLRQAGGDPVMQRIQDQVFDAQYWKPAEDIGISAGLKQALSYLAIYDCCIHSGPARVASLRQGFPELPPARGGDERAWTRAFIGARHRWLANFSGRNAEHTALVRRTVYRTEALNALADAGRWDLARPLRVRGVTIV